MKFPTFRSRIAGRLRLQAMFALTFAVAACGGGSPEGAGEAIHHEKAVLAARTIPVRVPATAPVPEGARADTSGTNRVDDLTALRPAVAYVSECVVDFTDSTALQMTEPSLWFDRIYLPWFQQCGGLAYVDVRPLVMEHVHLGFADSDVLPCNTHPQAYPARIGGDGTCNLVDVPTEPRTYVTTHTGAEILRIMAQKADHATRAVFDLNRIRIPGTQPVRLCYKKRVEGPIGPWKTTDPNGGPPGVWLCWNQLDPGTWNLSDWVWDVTEVKVTGTPGVSVNFSIDDLHVGIR